MTPLNRIIREHCLKEGKKVSVSRGNVAEIFGNVSQSIAEDLYNAGFRRMPYAFRASKFLRGLRSSVNKKIKILEKKELTKKNRARNKKAR